MKTFVFFNKHSSVVISLSANNLMEAEKLLFETVQSNYGWVVEDEEGTDNDFN